MSEAHDYFDDYDGARTNIAKLRFTPNEALREHLTDFFNQAYTASLGKQALFLYSERGLYYAEDRQRLVDSGFMSDIRGLKEVDDLQQSLKHRSSGQRRLAPNVEFKRLPDEDPGLLMRLGVIIDELTARALRHTVFMEGDRTVRVNLRVPSRHLDQGPHLLDARDRLLDALETGRPVLAVDSLELMSREQRQ